MNRRKLLKMALSSGAALATTSVWAKGGNGGTSGKGGNGGNGADDAGGGGGRGGNGGGRGGRGGNGGACIAGQNGVPDGSIASPKTTPFKAPMPRMQEPSWAPDQSGFTGAPCSDVTGISKDDAIQRSSHQYYSQFLPKRYYEIWEKEIKFDFTGGTGELPLSPAWGFNGQVPGPLIKSQYGTPALVRMHNALPPVSDLGFGIPSTTTHLHNAHTASESDGFPGDFINPGQFHDHHYINACPGFSVDGVGDKREALNTLWYHDHRVDFTAQNTYAGLIGMHLLFDDQDTGDETTGLRLPSGDYDVPIIFFDKRFDVHTGLLAFDLNNLDGMLGDKWCANGVIQPYFEVEARKYRFRLLGVGPSRWWEFHLSDDSFMFQIGEDGNLLPQPIARQGIRQGVAERTDVIIDFSKYKPGTKLYLQNRLEQHNGRGPTGNVFCQGDNLIEFRVIPAQGKDNSVIPVKMRDLPPVNISEVVQRRTFNFGRSNGGWTVNGRFFDLNRIDAHVKRNTAELWTLTNGGGWSHPVHIHFEEFRILSRNGAAPPANEIGRKDVIKLNPSESVTFFMRFRDWSGRYPMHCHNTVHEDHAMMVRWELEA